MLLRCDMAGRKTDYRPRSLDRVQDLIRLRGLLPLRIGSVVELPEGLTTPGLERARVSRCECAGDGLYVIDLEILGN